MIEPKRFLRKFESEWDSFPKTVLLEANSSGLPLQPQEKRGRGDSYKQHFEQGEKKMRESILKSFLAVFAIAFVSAGFSGTATAQYKSQPEIKSQSESKTFREDTSGGNIVDVAVALNNDGPFAGEFDTLIAAIGAADPFVAATLSRKGQFTVFAPTDGAFAELGLDPATVVTLPQDLLTSVLLYHVAPGRRYAEDVLDAYRIRTLFKSFIFQSGGNLIDNLGREVGFVATDVEATNGVIHAVDRVLLPFAP